MFELVVMLSTRDDIFSTLLSSLLFVFRHKTFVSVVQLAADLMGHCMSGARPLPPLSHFLQAC